MTAILSITPPDLRGISEAKGYDLADLVRRIDGRDMILAHGGPMPLFGQLLQGESAVVDDAGGTPVFTSQEVLDIVTWIAALER